MKKHIWAMIALTVVALLTGCEQAPDEINIEHHNLFPEGLEYDQERGHFLLGSLTEGTVFRVADDGTLEPFIEDDELQMSIGIEIDRINDRLLVANTSPSEEVGMLGAYDLETGERIFMAELSDLHPSTRIIANDVAVDTDGIAYVTDSDAPVIYRVDMEGQTSIFIEDQRFRYLNGIVAHPDGYLILGSDSIGLLKIPLEEPEVIEIELADDIRWFSVTDGMILHPDGSLIMVTFPLSVIYRLESDDNWGSAGLVAVSEGHDLGWGTTVALRGESVYVIYSHLDRWMNGLDRDTFEVVRVEFEEDE
jgi:sugar lactone lactonase YvrE